MPVFEPCLISLQGGREVRLYVLVTLQRVSFQQLKTDLLLVISDLPPPARSVSNWRGMLLLWPHPNQLPAEPGPTVLHFNLSQASHAVQVVIVHKRVVGFSLAMFLLTHLYSAPTSLKHRHLSANVFKDIPTDVTC